MISSSIASLALRQIAQQMTWVERYSKGKQDWSSAGTSLHRLRALIKGGGLVDH